MKCPAIAGGPPFHEISESRADEIKECSHAKRPPGPAVIECMNLLVVTGCTFEHFDQVAGRDIVANMIVGEPSKADARYCHLSQRLSVVCKERATDRPVDYSPAIFQRPDRGGAPEIESQAVVTHKILNSFWLTQTIDVFARRDDPSFHDADASGDQR